MGAPRAVKVVWRRQFDSDRPYEREFAGIQRYEPVSRSADGLVHVLHVGRNDAAGYFYYVMELADAANPSLDTTAVLEESPASADVTPLGTYDPRTLRNDLKRLGRLPTANCLRLALDVVSGLAQLHREGLVHRDVKPGNIIYVHGRAKLADIGLVSARGEGRTFVGTEGYIPPEGPGSPAADLYALGIVLYEASTGFPPERFPDVPTEWLAEHVGDDALELHEVILRACESDRERRYQGAEEMQADLALLQSGQSVRRVRALERRVARAKRFGWAAAIIVAFAVTTALAANWRARVESANRDKERQLRARAEAAESEARQQLNAALLEQARALVVSREMGHRTRALDAVRRVVGTTNAAELRGVVFAALGQPDLRLLRELTISENLAHMFADPQLERLAVCSGRAPVSIFSLADSRVVATLTGDTNLPTYFARWSRDGRFLAIKRNADANGRQGELDVWDFGANGSQSKTQSFSATLESSNVVPRLILDRAPVAYLSCSFRSNKPFVMAGRVNGWVTVWNLEDGDAVREFRLPGTVHSLAFSPDDTRFATSYRFGTNWVVACHNTATLEPVMRVETPEAVEGLAWHPSGRWIGIMGGPASTEWNRNVRLIEADTGASTVLGRHKLKTAHIEFAGKGHYLVSGGWDREIIWWDLRTRERAFTFADVDSYAGWSADGRRCVAKLSPNVLGFYQFDQPDCRELELSEADGLGLGAFSPDGRWLVAQDVRHVLVWDLHREGPPARVKKPGDVTLSFSPDSTELFASRRNYLRSWRLTASADAGAPPRLEPLPVRVPNGLRHTALLANDVLMTTTGGVHIVALTNWPSGQGRLVRAPEGVCFASPDGRWLGMVYPFSRLVRVYRLPEFEEAAVLITSNNVASLTFSPDGEELTIISRGGIEWWDTATWQPNRQQPGTPVSPSFVRYTPDGSGLWIVTQLRNTGLHDRRTLERLLPLPPNVVPIALSADGRKLAVSVEMRRVQLWDLPSLRARFRELGLDW
jgi:WD40 repeat protein